jgi:anti-anti-sigma factor
MLRWNCVPTLRITTERYTEHVIIRLKGSATTRIAAAWSNHVLQLLDERIQLLVIDLSQLRSASHLFLALLERLILCLERQGGRVTLIRPRPIVMQMLEHFELDLRVEYDEATEPHQSHSPRKKPPYYC